MTAQLSPQPLFQAFATNGQFLVGGKLFTYAAGTTTPQATYIDSTQTTPNTNPVILNAMGQANVWLDPTKTYKFVLQDASGNPLWTVDNVPAPFNVPALSGSLIPTVTNTYNIGSPSFTWANGYFGTSVLINGVPAIAYPQTDSELFASVTPTNYTIAPYNVLRYGNNTVPGTTDMTAAFQAALNSVSYIVSPTTITQCLAQGGQVYVPRGRYLTTSTLYRNSNVHIVGEDCGPIQESPLQITGLVGCAMILYKSATQQSIAIDGAGFWLQAQTTYTGTASAGGAQTITITTGLTIAASAIYIQITSGTGAGQKRPIQTYNSGTGVFTVGWPWVTPPDATSVWSIPGHAIGDRFTQLISGTENESLNLGAFSYSNGGQLKNLAIVSISSGGTYPGGHYMGMRDMSNFETNAAQNLLIAGFQVSLESTGCGYATYENITSVAQLIGFGWCQGDHLTRIQCVDFGVQATPSPLTVLNSPWFVSYQSSSGLDPNGNFWTAHYAFQEIGVYITCDGEGGDRSYYNQQSTSSLYLDCHMERMNQYGMWVSNGLVTWIGGDWFPTLAVAGFTGATCNLTIDGLAVSGSNYNAGARTIGQFPNTFGGRVTVRNTPPLVLDANPVAGQLTVWDAFPKSIAISTLNTVGAATLTAGALYGGAIIRGGAQVGAFSDTLDTAAHIIAQFIPVPIVGSTAQCTIYNTTTQVQTLLAGTGITFQTGTLTIAAASSRTLTMSIGNIGTPAVNIVG
jgi:hypothetical protein